MLCEKEIFEDIVKFIGLNKEHCPDCINGPDLMSQVSKSREQSAIRRERKTREIPACEVRIARYRSTNSQLVFYAACSKLLE